MRFAYCPACGRRLVDKRMPDGTLVPCCVPCGRMGYDQPFPGILALAVNSREEVALLREHAGGGDRLVAGPVLSGESGEEAALRQVGQTLGLAGNATRYLGSYAEAEQDRLLLGYAVRVAGDVFALPDTVDAAVWLPAAMALERLREDGPARRLVQEYLRADSRP